MFLATETLSLAGEYAVASELCRRGVYCQLTLGNRKKTDLLVDTEIQLFRVSVKAKQKKSWPKVKGIWQAGDLLVFVDYEDKKITECPDFYVLDVTAWKKVVAQKHKNDERTKIDSENTLFWPGAKGEKNTWTGCAVSIAEIEKFKDKWPEFNV